MSSQRSANVGTPQPSMRASHHVNQLAVPESQQRLPNSTSMPFLTSGPSAHQHRHFRGVAEDELSGRPADPFSLPRITSLTSGEYSDYQSNRGETLPSIKSDFSRILANESPQRRNMALEELTSTRTTPSLPTATTTSSASSSSRTLPSLLTMSPSPKPDGLVERSQRIILTPRSPLQRAQGFSQSHLHPSQATIPARSNPFPTSPSVQTFLRDSNLSGSRSGPTPPPHYSMGRHDSHVQLSAPQARSVGGRSSPALNTLTGSHLLKGASCSASPSGSFSSFSQPDQTSPVAQYRPPGSLSYPPASRYTPSSEHMASTEHLEHLQEQTHQAAGIPVSTSGANSTYQMMMIQTTSGAVSVPVDVQAASKLADEKRKRNAGASARFRERRKKKEVEASVTIRKFELQVKELTEDADFYRRERDYFANVVLQQGGARHFPRPQSPRIRRPRLSPATIEHRAEYDGTSDMQGHSSDDSDRNVRRRTSSFASSARAQDSTSTTSAPTYPNHRRVTPPSTASSSIDFARRMTATAHTYPPGNRGHNHPEGYAQQPSAPPPLHSSVNPHATGSHYNGPGEQSFNSGHAHAQAPPPSVLQASPPTGPHNPYGGHRFERH